MKRLTILLLMMGLGACASYPESSAPEASAPEADLSRRYVSVLERQARSGFKTIHWVTLPSNAQVERRLGRARKTD